MIWYNKSGMNALSTSSKRPMQQRARLLELVGWLLIIFGLVVVAQRLITVMTISSDFTQDYLAAQALRVGISIYTDFTQYPILLHDYPQQALFETPKQINNFHPPFMALFFLPLTFLPYSVAITFWNILSIAFYLGIGVIIGRALHIKLARHQLILLLGTALCWYPFAAHIALGQISLQLILPLIGCWALLRHGHPRWAGALLGFACLLKLFPGLIVAFLLFIGLRNLLRSLSYEQATDDPNLLQLVRRLTPRRVLANLREPHWQAATTAIVVIGSGTLLVMLVVGRADMLLYSREVVPQQLEIFRAFLVNHALSGPINRLLVDGPWVQPVLVAPLAAEVLNTIGRLAVLAVVVYQIWCLPATRRGDDIAFSLSFIAMLLISPLTWQHGFPVLALPFGLLLKTLLEGGNTRALVWYLLPLFLLSVPDVELARSLMAYYEPYRMPSYASLLLLAPVIGLLLLWWLVSTELDPAADPHERPAAQAV
jgi:hypothetical protein